MTEELTQAELFDVFSNARRRLAVRYLIENGGSTDLAPLVEQIAAWENVIQPADVTRTQRRRVYISLYQTHLPMLEDHGIVDWDPETHSIELLQDDVVFEPYLDTHTSEFRSWHRLYASLAVAGVLAYGMAILTIGPLTVDSAPVVALLLCGLFLVISLVHIGFRNRRLRLPFSSSS